MNIILIGPPACGKGTQAKRLKELFGLNYISTGDLFRQITKQDSDLANEIRSYIDNGRFVPDELTLKLVEEHFKTLDMSKGLLLDGFPRTVYQAKQLEKLINIDYILEICVSRQCIIKRVIDRGVCGGCGKGFILSQTNGLVCDECGKDIVKRKDDTEEIAVLRYDDYIQKTYPIIEYFKNHTGYHKIDGEKPINEITKEICKILEK
ncbi:MAG: nucleoside monophosphate kinase [Clostridia bacterium]|nr:nucleoside monophosphate kinase [Clostridia bacterium]